MLPIDNGDGEAVETSNVPTGSSPSKYITPVAKPQAASAQVSFYETCALPEVAIQWLSDPESAPPWIRALKQWRLDQPMPTDLVQDYFERNMLVLAETILCRGSATLCSPTIESMVFSESGLDERVPDDDQVEDALREVACSPTNKFFGDACESDEENILREALVKHIKLKHLSWSVMPQVDIASISGDQDDRSAQRVDFLLAHPTADPIVIEVDGQQHDDQAAIDEARDQTLSSAGAQVLRVRASDIRDIGPEHMPEIWTALDQEELAERDRPQSGSPGLVTAFRWSKICHQLQLSLLQAIRGGWLALDSVWQVNIRLPDDLRADGLAQVLPAASAEDLRELLLRLSSIHGSQLRIPEPEILVVSNSDNEVGNPDAIVFSFENGFVHSASGNSLPTFAISDVQFPHNILFENGRPSVSTISDPSEEDCEWMLSYIFRKEAFLPGQFPAIRRMLQGQEALVLLPTGAGKSIAFQLAALLRGGPCIVIDPIKALIADQVGNLAAYGIDRSQGISSDLTREERKAAEAQFGTDQQLFTFVAPERLQDEDFRRALRSLTTRGPISLIVIDETHCVSEWGHDFRTAYLNIARTARNYCTHEGQAPPLAGLTGTASRAVLKDCQRELMIEDYEAVITPESFDRPELQFSVYSCRSDEKLARIEGFLYGLPNRFGVTRNTVYNADDDVNYAGVIFCPHVNGDYGVLTVKEHLENVLGTTIGIYAGSAPKYMSNGDDWERYRHRTSRSFKRRRLPMLVATNAFGMGIDIPQIRYTVHTGLPRSIEAFYQEAGRAGRTRERSYCALVISNDDPARSRDLLDPNTDIERVREIIDALDWGEDDDVTRQMWFHLNSFQGKSREIDDVKSLIANIGDLQSVRDISLVWRNFSWTNPDTNQDPKIRLEKAVHRLVTLGVVRNYTVNYSGREILADISGADAEQIREAAGVYVDGFQPSLGAEMRKDLERFSHTPLNDYILAVATELIEFVYDHIEKGRRRSLGEMLQAAEIGVSNPENFRRRLLTYLQKTPWDEAIDEICQATTRTRMFDKAIAILADIHIRDAEELNGATRNVLVDYFENPGLLLLGIATEVLSETPNEQFVQQDLQQLVSGASELGHDELTIFTKVFVKTIMVLQRLNDNDAAAMLLIDRGLKIASEQKLDPEFARVLIRDLSPNLTESCKRWLLHRLMDRVDIYLSSSLPEVSND